MFLFVTTSILALGPTQSPIQWVPMGVTPEIKRPGCKADNASPPSPEVKNA